MALFTHHIPQRDQNAIVLEDASGEEVARAIQSKKLAEELVKECGVSERSAVLLVPFEEGPLGALHVMHGLLRASPKPFDRILPMYVQRSEDYSLARVLSPREPEAQKSIQNSLPLGVWYDGYFGEPVVNTVRGIREASDGKGVAENHQLFSTVQLSGIPRLKLEDWSVRVDLGWVRESPRRGGPEDPPFPIDLNPDELREMTGLSGALLRQVLNNKSGTLSSPLRSIEILRSEIIKLLANTRDKKTGSSRSITRLEIYKRIDEIYPRYATDIGLNVMEYDRFTSMVLATLEHGRIIKVEHQRERQNDSISIGDRWDEWLPLLDCYITFSGVSPG
jgi:hypothetical protein